MESLLAGMFWLLPLSGPAVAIYGFAMKLRRTRNLGLMHTFGSPVLAIGMGILMIAIAESSSLLDGLIGQDTSFRMLLIFVAGAAVAYILSTVLLLIGLWLRRGEISLPGPSRH